MHVVDGSDVRDATLPLTATHEHKVVWSHTGGPATATPDASARRQRTDEQVPGDLSRSHLSDSAVLPNVQDAGASWTMKPCPQPARLGACDVAPESLVDRYAASRAT
jgi:hypothetical protein